MSIFERLLDFIKNIDTYVIYIVNSFGIFAYLILFLIIFIETGIFIMPFVPGDSILFVVGLIASQRALNLFLIVLVLIIAAILGDACNYLIGRFLGNKFLRNDKIQKHLGKQIEKTRNFYNDHGNLSITYARFVPIVRTLAPFIAGVAGMHYRTFAMYNVIGGVLWVTLMTLAGYFLGNVAFVRDHLTLIILLIVFLSLIPPIIGFIRSKKSEKNEKAQ